MLCFGAGDGDLPGQHGRVEVLRLQKQVPDGGARSILSVWTEDLAEAAALADSWPGLALPCTPVAAVVPDGSWTHLRLDPEVSS